MFKIETLKINYTDKPINVVGTPSFSWTYKNSKNVAQKSYRLLVTKKKDLLETNQADLYDSGEIISNKMIDIPYLGKELPARTTCYVKLVVSSLDGEETSKETYFETSLGEGDWHGRWVSIPDNFNGGTLLFRKKLELKDKPVKKARAYIIGIGYHEFYVNAKKVGDQVLNPGVTDYDQTLLYDVYPFESFINKGEDNIIGIEVGYGWYGSRKMLAQFYVEYADGEIYEDHSDCNFGWWVSGSPVIDNSIYGGEVYDARIEALTDPHWCSPDFEPTWGNGWMYTILTQAPKGKKVPQEIPPIRICGEFPEKTRNVLSENNIVFDIGQNIAGWVKIKVKGKSGAKVTLKFAEGLKEDGHVNQLNLRSARCSDTYILKGEGVETYAPRFTYHGFQYIEAIIEGQVEIIELVGQHVHSDLKMTGSFHCDDEIINHLHHMAVITEQNNDMSILTDCPQRDERFGWLNDVSSRVYQQIYNFDMDRMFNKVVRDIRQTANEQGAISDTAPYYTGGQPADVTSASFLLLGTFTHNFYGDKEIVINEYEGQKKWVEYLLTRQKDFIMDYYYYADWVNPTTLNDSFSDGIYVSTLFLNWHLQLMVELANIIGNEEDTKHYSELVEESKKAINEKYYHTDTKNYCNGTQCENAMAVTLDICPQEDKEAVVKNIVDNIIKNNYHMTCGNQGYRHVFYLLCEYGYSDIAIKILKNPEYPGWGYMVACGATTVWERWESKMENIMHSFDHPMFGSYDGIFYHYWAGIQIENIKTQEITIHPYIPESLNNVEASFASAAGKIVSNWRKEDGKVIHEIEVPGNVKANLIFNNKVISINDEAAEGNTIVVGSGKYIIVTEM